MPSAGNLAAVAHAGDHVAQRLRVAGHLKAHIESFRHPKLFLHFGERSLGRIDGQSRAHLARKIEPEWIHIGNYDMARAGVAHHGNSHDADGPGAGDQHVFSEHRKRERCVDSVAEGVKDCSNFLIDTGMVTPDVGHRQRNEFGKSARAIDAYALRVIRKDGAAPRGSCGSGRTQRGPRR